MKPELGDFFEFIFERQSIWHKKMVEKLYSPWSEDEILNTYRFCNVYRELDGGTIAINKYLQEKNISPEMKLFNIVAYRFFNRRDTIEVLFVGLLNPQDFAVKSYEKRFDDEKKRGSIFSNAYLVSSHPYNSNYRPKDKHVQILLMLDDLKDNLSKIIKELQSSSPDEGLKIIEKNIKMAGPFLSGQILLDVTYAGDIVNYTSNDFLIVGPGAHWGLNILFDKKLSKIEANEKCRYLYSIQQEAFANLLKNKNKNWKNVNWKNEQYCGGEYLSLHDIQNSLCEFRKYWRLKADEKSKKRYYQVK